MRSRGGFSRGPDEPTPAELRAPNLWQLDYREGGTFCVLDPAVLMLWRPNVEGDTALEIESGGKKTTVAIVAGANFRKWPNDVLPGQYRSEEGRVWQECVRTCRYRWSACE